MRVPSPPFHLNSRIAYPFTSKPIQPASHLFFPIDYAPEQPTLHPTHTTQTPKTPSIAHPPTNAPQYRPSRALSALALLITLTTLTACHSTDTNISLRVPVYVPPEAQHPKPPLGRFEFEHPQMGTLFNITLYACSLSEAAAAANAAFQRIDQLNQTLSDYLPDSELSQLAATAGTNTPIPLSPDLYTMLADSLDWYEKSHHAFDITIRPVVRLWRRARQNNRFPDPQRLADALALVSSQNIILDRTNHTATLTQPNMTLDLGGIAKGYATDEALKTLKQYGITRALITGGGGITLGDPPPNSNGWRIALRPLLSTDTNPDPDSTTNTDQLPQHTLIASNIAIATSGDAFQHVIINNKRYSHIIDPRTGIGLTPPIGVTVIASNGTTADALSTAVSILGPTQGLQLVEQTPDASAIIIQLTDDQQLKTYTSKRFNQLNLETTP